MSVVGTDGGNSESPPSLQTRATPIRAACVIRIAHYQSICETVQSHLNALSRLVSSRPNILNDFLVGERTYIEEEDLTIGGGVNYR
ncbi:uncharacterized protein ARMOST_20248 [Armillaria ostoyae]|uniref:Uncharacterized protein n=1 Tax=Armillaria ostoyae TaxID=47428 RepID=A0A284S6U3_ARMOS|nr:uncharacterized protein ARMOST_20248 [Armillaria ostoyae]